VKVSHRSVQIFTGGFLLVARLTSDFVFFVACDTIRVQILSTIWSMQHFLISIWTSNALLGPKWNTFWSK